MMQEANVVTYHGKYMAEAHKSIGESGPTNWPSPHTNVIASAPSSRVPMSSLAPMVCPRSNVEDVVVAGISTKKDCGIGVARTEERDSFLLMYSFTTAHTAHTRHTTEHECGNERRSPLKVPLLCGVLLALHLLRNYRMY